MNWLGKALNRGGKQAVLVGLKRRLVCKYPDTLLAPITLYLIPGCFRDTATQMELSYPELLL